MDPSPSQPWPRLIAHVDMDAFYASIEIRDDPSLAGQPVVVGGSAEGRGVVSAASYEARTYGIHSAMPMAEALRRCPHLVRISGHFGKYEEASRQIMEIFRSYSPKVEPLSLDEAFLDLTGTERLFGSPRQIGQSIKAAILSRTHLTASVGLAPVKFVAKIASDYEKPDGLTIVRPDELTSFLHGLDIARLWGVGPRSQEALHTMGIQTVGDLAAQDRTMLTARFGAHGEHLYRLAHGQDAREVVPDWEAKSYSHEHTFGRDQDDPEVLEGMLLDEATRVSRRLRRDGVAGRIVQIKLRYGDFSTFTRRTTLSVPTADSQEIYRAARHLFHKNWTRRPIRLIGVGVSAIHPGAGATLDLFAAPAHERRERLADALDRIESRFGPDKVLPAKVLPLHHRDDIGKPALSDRPLREDADE